MNKIKEVLERYTSQRWAKIMEIPREKNIQEKLLQDDDEYQCGKQALIQFSEFELSLNKLLGEMDEFALTYCESIKHVSGEAKNKFLEFYNKLDLILKGKKVYKSKEKVE